MDSRTGHNEVQKALFSLLTGLSLTAYDNVPENPTLPYCVIGEDSGNDFFDNKDETKRVIETSIEIFTDKQAFKEGKDILDSIYLPLKNMNLSIDHFSIEDLKIRTYSNKTGKEILVTGLEIDIEIKQID